MPEFELVEANPSRGADALNAPGMVLIDEIELRLHPGWQQRILPDLLRTFPNVQFVVTTHSPQVLSSVPTKHIRTIDAAGNIASTSCKLHGAESKRVLEEILQVSSRPAALAGEIQEFVRITDAGDWTSSSSH